MPIVRAPRRTNSSSTPWILLFAAMVGISLGAVAFVAQRWTSQSLSKPKPRPKNLLVVSAEELFRAYEENELKADAAYKDKLFAVQGTVHSVGRDILGTPYVALRAGGQAIFLVQCMFAAKDEARLAQITQGQTLTIAGKGGGKMGNVLLFDCWLYSE